jgi:hypothetical protein
MKTYLWWLGVRYRLWVKRHFIRPVLSERARKGWQTRRARA